MQWCKQFLGFVGHDFFGIYIRIVVSKYNDFQGSHYRLKNCLSKHVPIYTSNSNMWSSFLIENISLADLCTSYCYLSQTGKKMFMCQKGYFFLYGILGIFCMYSEDLKNALPIFSK